MISFRTSGSGIGSASADISLFAGAAVPVSSVPDGPGSSCAAEDPPHAKSIPASNTAIIRFIALFPPAVYISVPIAPAFSFAVFSNICQIRQRIHCVSCRDLKNQIRINAYPSMIILPALERLPDSVITIILIIPMSYDIYESFVKRSE
jgi:hypothetical protein